MRDVRLHHRVRPLPAVVLAVGAVLLVVALTLGVPWSAVGHGLAQVSVAGWCAIVGSTLVGGVGLRFAWTRAWAKAWRDTRWGWIGLVIVAPVGALTLLALLLLFASVDTTQASVRIDVIKTALSVGAGAGALAALLLASRKQWSTERSNYDARHDAAERRITELYTKAADQLGSDKAPVRLAGLYALERLAQDNERQRQTIVNLLCAYLRMPYQPPGEPPNDEDDEQIVAAHRERVQEREVRLAAQRLLTDHLQPHNADTFWKDTDLDLTGALLISFSLARCTLRNATFRSATFIGNADFGSASFINTANFVSATFTGTAYFGSATFTSDAHFQSATFTSNANFWSATFTKTANFELATFTSNVNFTSASFINTANFTSASFTSNAYFGWTTFTSNADFRSATFTSDPDFRLATFTSNANFGSATFTLGVPTEVARFLPPAGEIKLTEGTVQRVSDS